MKISEHALKAARSIVGYCVTRFPDEKAPVNLPIDLPWFAEKVQIAIDAAVAEKDKEEAKP